MSCSPENSSNPIITTTVAQVEKGIYSNYKNKKRRIIPDAVVVELAVDGTNVLEFWKAKSFDYPILSAMAKDYLTVQASSVPAERAFSSGTDLVTADRLGFLRTRTNSNMPKFEFEFELVRNVRRTLRTL